MRYRIALHQSDEGYSVSVPGLPGCWSQGATEAEAIENIKDALREYLAVVDEQLRGELVTRAEVISSSIRSAVPDADLEVETDLSPQVADGPCLARTAKRHSDRRR